MDTLVSLLFCYIFALYTLCCSAQQEPVKEGPLNFDIETKKKQVLPTCSFNFKYDLAKAIVSALCFILGAFILVFGYKRRRISFCFTALTSVSLLTYLVLISEAKFTLLINILISLSTGLFVSLFTTTLIYCGYFMTGLFSGIVIGFIFLLIYTSFTPVGSVALSCVIVAGFGLVQVFITMWWRHRVYIVSSCLFAAALMACALDYFVEGLFLLQYIEMKVFYNRVAELCWWSYLVFALFGLFLIIGLLVQCLCTGKELQKEPYTFIYLTRRRRKNEATRNRQDEHNQLINS